MCDVGVKRLSKLVEVAQARVIGLLLQRLFHLSRRVTSALGARITLRYPCGEGRGITRRASFSGTTSKGEHCCRIRHKSFLGMWLWLLRFFGLAVNGGGLIQRVEILSTAVAAGYGGNATLY